MSDVCECGKATDDHTLRELREHHPAEALNLPYEQGHGQMTSVPMEGQGAPAGALVVRALVVSVPDGPALGLPRALPALGFTFFAPDGVTEIAKTVLLLDDQRMRAVRTLVGSAVDDSIRLARRAR